VRAGKDDQNYLFISASGTRANSASPSILLQPEHTSVKNQTLPVFVPTRRTCRPITQNLVTTTAAANAASSGAGALGGGSGGRDKDAQHWQGRPDKWDSRPSGFDRDGRSPDGRNRCSTSGPVRHTKDAADANNAADIDGGSGTQTQW
jgi:hypothetical protein